MAAQIVQYLQIMNQHNKFIIANRSVLLRGVLGVGEKL